MIKITQKIILIDCFDTIIHRSEHPYQVLKRWSKCLERLYPKISSEKIYSDRFHFIKISNRKIDEVGIYFIYELMAKQYLVDGLIDEREYKLFIEDARKLEILCESSVHYIDDYVLNILKSNADKQVFCVTDFHLSEDDMFKFFDNLGISHLIKRIFSSADYNSTKHEGSLYSKILKELNISANECIMIGDNKISDIKHAEIRGIKGYYKPHRFHKNKLKVLNQIAINSKDLSIEKIARRIYKKYNCFEEYIAIFYVFCYRLYFNVKDEKGKKIIFLSREGYYLKKCFDLYQGLCIPKKDRFETDYFKCSRRAIRSVQEDKIALNQFNNISMKNYLLSIGFNYEEIKNINLPFDKEKIIGNFSESNELKILNSEYKEIIDKRIRENKLAFEKYLKYKITDNTIFIVDVGWIGRMQQGIAIKFPNMETKGFYIGIYEKLSTQPDDIERKGLIFNKNISGQKSKYFDILRANTQLYEQLLAAPHGSANGYRFDLSGKVKIDEIWEKEEKELYKNVIQLVQERMLKEFSYISCLNFDNLNSENTTKELAKIVLRSGLIQNRNRLEFMENLSNGFIQNYGQQTKGLKYGKSVQINIKEIIIHPEKYVRYFVKLGGVMGVFSNVINVPYYWYVKIRNRLF